MRNRFLVVLFLLVTVPSFAERMIDPFEGIAHATIEVNGKAYSFPIGRDEGGRDRTNDVYMLKKALKGDKDALEVFLGGNEVRSFFIGRERPLWLVVSKEKIEVIEP